jgi:hypothetical protein
MPGQPDPEPEPYPDSLTDYENWMNSLAETAAGLKKKEEEEE